MIQEDKDLLLKDLSSRISYGVYVQTKISGGITTEGILWSIGYDETESYIFHKGSSLGYDINGDIIKPYLRSLSSMTEEEAKEIAILHDIIDILSVKVTSNYIDVIIDDGFCSTMTRTIWYDEIISSIEIFDWCNKNHFDYRGLIEKGLAIEAPKGMYK